MKSLRFMLIFLTAMLVFPVIGMAEEDASIKAAREVRIEQAKQSFPIRLSDQEKATLSKHCLKAQVYLSKIAVRLDARESIIASKYALIDRHLSAVQTRLTIKQVDTSIIDLLLGNFRKLTSEHQQAFANYQLALEDATSIDCVAEPQSFKALVEDVRSKRQEFVNTINAIKDFSGADLKTSFDALRTRLNSRILE